MTDAERLAELYGPHGVALLLRLGSCPGPARVELTMHIHPGGRVDFETLERQKTVDPRPRKA
jgi:diadenosine tetraphosphate (Ap4A) HIT family hydrolase